jgi:folate-binding protein YgfZ
VDSLITLSAGEVVALTTQRLLVLRDDAVFRIEGPGAIDCLQGLLTNDVKAGGDHGLVWGAVLTPKGMIISDAWIRREGPTRAIVAVPASAHEAIRTLFQRSLPPRLAKCTDLSGQLKVGWFLGGAPEAHEEFDVAIPHGPAPFAAMMLSRDATVALARAATMGWETAGTAFAEAAKVLLGWPTLGREIDERTLVQEVRFDELAGVRYDKGCFTGQETVARLHFRGHPNRALRGIVWKEGEAPTSTDVVLEGKTVGSLGTVATLGGETVALAVLRREVAIGAVVETGTTKGTVVELPFPPRGPLVA